MCAAAAVAKAPSSSPRPRLGQDQGPRLGAPVASLAIPGCVSFYHATLVGLVNWYNTNPKERLEPLICLTSPTKRARTKASLRRLDHIVRTVLRSCPALEPMHADYKAQVHANKRHMFDPFCRARIIHLHVTHGGVRRRVRTCVAQLNFVRWVLERNIVTPSAVISRVVARAAAQK